MLLRLPPYNTLAFDSRSHLINGKVALRSVFLAEAAYGPNQRAVGGIGTADPRPSSPSRERHHGREDEVVSSNSSGQNSR
jgi:hypothetical protein